MTDRHEPATEGLGERETLDAWLDYHRATLLWKCEGLSDADLKKRSVPPSNLTLLGMVRHMADVERSWFRRVFAGEQGAGPIFYSDERPNDDFDDLDGAPVDEVFQTFRQECDLARKIVSSAESLDVVSSGERRTKNGHRYSLRWIVTHMIEEYARHNGHADLLREAIDGSTGD
ncbi:MAG TPA: DinB family protein [Actinomycetota bacterium]|nr:DinB family protein [Actinomycetota bacterium]